MIDITNMELYVMVMLMVNMFVLGLIMGVNK